MTESDYRESVFSATLRGDTAKVKLEANEKKELLTAQGLPPYTEMARLGGGFSAIAVVAVAGLVVRPAALANVTLFNNEQPGGKSYIIDRLFAHCLVSGAESGRFGIWACIHPAGMTNPGVDLAASATQITSNTGKTYGGRAVFGIEETVVDNGWYPWGGSQSYELTGILPGAVAEAEVAGRLIVPPQGGISLQVVASMADSTYCPGLSWFESVLDVQ